MSIGQSEVAKRDRRDGVTVHFCRMFGFVGIKAFAAAIVGGFGSMPGAIIGGLLIGIIEQFAGLYLPPGFADTSAYVLLLVMLLVRPQGLFATMQKKKV